MHLENNILIAEFMGKKIISADEFNKLGEWSYTGVNSKVEWGIIEYLKYHSSWDWLMSVIQKIKFMNLEDPSMTDKIDFYLTRCNLECTYEYTVELIKNLQE